MEDLEIPGEDPVERFRTLLQEESLQERFQRVLVSAFRRVCDGGYFPGRELLEAVERGGAIPFTREWLGDERAQPVLDVLCQSRRWDLAVEWLVERVPYCRLFSHEERVLAKAHLSAVPWRWKKLRNPDWDQREPEDGIEWAEAAITNLSAGLKYSRRDYY